VSHTFAISFIKIFTQAVLYSDILCSSKKVFNPVWCRPPKIFGGVSEAKLLNQKNSWMQHTVFAEDLVYSTVFFAQGYAVFWCKNYFTDPEFTCKTDVIYSIFMYCAVLNYFFVQLNKFSVQFNVDHLIFSQGFPNARIL
jgi:hypothetical protein